MECKADYFKMYKVYCANQTNSLQTVEVLMKKNPQFKKNLDICHRDPSCKGLFLQSFLIKPIQRVCKYPLLLRVFISPSLPLPSFLPPSPSSPRPLPSSPS